MNRTSNTGTQSLIRNSENWKAPKTEIFFMEVVRIPKLTFGRNMPQRDTLSTHTTQVCCVQAFETRRGVAPSWLRHSCPTSQSARCNVPLLHVYVHVYSLVWACLCSKFYLEIKSTLVILWSIFIPLKINNAMKNIYQLVLISCAILSLSSWPLIPPTTSPKSEKFRFPKRVWSQGFQIRDCVPVFYFYTYIDLCYSLHHASLKFIISSIHTVKLYLNDLK
jgi:hypothetical protein